MERGAEVILRGLEVGEESWALVFADERADGWDGAAGVEDVDDGVLVGRRYFDCGVGFAGGGTTDEEGDGESLAIHFRGHVNHLVE
ncbi:MAG: hypothetical protein RIS92_3195 [Verrucomicrobiota bacterium]